MVALFFVALGIFFLLLALFSGSDTPGKSEKLSRPCDDEEGWEMYRRWSHGELEDD
jgi:hypothetical protein